MVKHQISAPAPARGGAFGTFFFPLPLPPIAGVVVCGRARRPSGTEKMHRDRTESSQNKVTAALRQLTGSYLPASSAAAIFSVTVTTVTVFLTLTGANNSRQLTAVPSLIHMCGGTNDCVWRDMSLSVCLCGFVESSREF